MKSVNDTNRAAILWITQQSVSYWGFKACKILYCNISDCSELVIMFTRV